MTPNRKTLAELICQASGEPGPVLARWAGNVRLAGPRPVRERRPTSRRQE